MQWKNTLFSDFSDKSICNITSIMKLHSQRPYCLVASMPGFPTSHKRFHKMSFLLQQWLSLTVIWPSYWSSEEMAYIMSHNCILTGFLYFTSTYVPFWGRAWYCGVLEIVTCFLRQDVILKCYDLLFPMLCLSC